MIEKIENPLNLKIDAVDLLIEQVASQMDYWHFSNGIAGIQNYIGWFIISFFTSVGINSLTF